MVHYILKVKPYSNDRSHQWGLVPWWTINDPASRELEITKFCGYHGNVRGEFRLVGELLPHEELSGHPSLMWWGCVTEKFVVLGSRDHSVQFPEVREYIAGGNLARGIVSLIWWGLVLVSVSCHIPVEWWLSQGCRWSCCTGESHPACLSAPAWRGWSSGVGGSWNGISCPLATNAVSFDLPVSCFDE